MQWMNQSSINPISLQPFCGTIRGEADNRETIVKHMFFLEISTLIPMEGLLQQVASPSIRTGSISIQKPEHHQSELDALS